MEEETDRLGEANRDLREKIIHQEAQIAVLTQVSHLALLTADVLCLTIVMFQQVDETPPAPGETSTPAKYRMGQYADILQQLADSKENERQLRHNVGCEQQDNIQLQADNKAQNQEIQRLKAELAEERSKASSADAIVSLATGQSSKMVCVCARCGQSA